MGSHNWEYGRSQGEQKVSNHFAIFTINNELLKIAV